VTMVKKLFYCEWIVLCHLLLAAAVAANNHGTVITLFLCLVFEKL